MINLAVIAAAVIVPALADVGFTGSRAYLKVAPTSDMKQRSFSLSEAAPELADINLRSDRSFEASDLERRILNAPISQNLKAELLNMLMASFMSAHAAPEFLAALADILKRIEAKVQFDFTHNY